MISCIWRQRAPDESAGRLVGTKSTHEIVYDQAVRAVDLQVGQLDELRNRSAVILAAAGVVTGFVAGGKGPHDWPGGFALGAFVVTACLCAYLLLPRTSTWQFSINANILIPYFLNEAEPEPPESLFRYLAQEVQADYEANQSELETLYRWFTVAVFALALEVVLWAGSMIG